MHMQGVVAGQTASILRGKASFRPHSTIGNHSSNAAAVESYLTNQNAFGVTEVLLPFRGITTTMSVYLLNA